MESEGAVARAKLSVPLPVLFTEETEWKRFDLDEARRPSSGDVWEYAKALDFAGRGQAARLHEVLEKEAGRMAHALHDDAGQLLAAVHIKLDEAARELPPQYAGCLQEIKSMIEQVEGQLRRLSHELRPTILDDLGLLPAIEFLAQGVANRTGISIRVEGSTKGRLPAAIETTMYRIVQEALTNITKHAQAKHVRIRLWRDGRIHCSVRDDGIGFDIGEVHRSVGCGLGLMGMRERLEVLAGTLLMTSRPGQGTDLQVTIPLETARVPDQGLTKPRRTA
jgi:two-component system, NarL family, sensor histidine kinase UhpB